MILKKHYLVQLIAKIYPNIMVVAVLAKKVCVLKEMLVLGIHIKSSNLLIKYMYKTKINIKY